MHYLDTGASEKKIVSREIKFAGPTGEIARQVLAKMIERAHESTDVYGQDLTNTFPTLSLCWEMLAAPETFVSNSAILTYRLNAAMSGKGNVSPGDVLIAIARDLNGPFAAILKLEKLREFERKYIPLPDGTFDLELVLNEDVVSSKEVPQKCAFIRHPGATPGYHVQLRDNQVRDKEAAAKFFYHDFLHCRLLPTPSKRTINFCNSAEAWRQENATFLPHQGIVSFTKALIQALREPEIAIPAFAELALRGANNPDLSALALAEQLTASVYARERAEGLFVPSTFTPDRETADAILKNVSLNLDGIRLSGPTDKMMQVIEAVENEDDGLDRPLPFRILASKVERSF